jgi:hypothetical protein
MSSIGFRVGNMQTGVFGPNALISVYIGDEDLLRGIERAKESRVLSVSAVDADPFKSHAPGLRLTHDVQRMFSLRC